VRGGAVVNVLDKIEELIGLLAARYCKDRAPSTGHADTQTKRILWGLSQLEEMGCPWKEIENAMWYFCAIVGNYDQVWRFVFGGNLER
jgi:hypothetical protein